MPRSFIWVIVVILLIAALAGGLAITHWLFLLIVLCVLAAIFL